MSQVKIPLSVRAYFCEPAVETATIALLNPKMDKNVLPKSWEELPKQFQSYLAAHQIKADFAQTLWGIWEAVWKPVLEKHGLKTKDFMSLADLTKSGESESSISELWDGGFPLQRLWIRGDDQFNFGVDFGGKNHGLRLLFWVNSNEQTRNLNLNENWLKKLHDHGWRVTRNVQIDRNDEYLQTDDLIDWAEDAASQMPKP